MGRSAIVAAILTVLGCVPLWGDVVQLKKGGTVEGIVTEEGDFYAVQTAYGITKIRKTEVETVVWEKSALQTYKERAAALDPKDAAGWFDLGRWARGEDLPPQADEAFQNVLAIDPDHGQAREALGYVLEDGRWLTRDEQMEAKGWIRVEGKWLSPEAVALRRALAEKDALEAEARRAEAEARTAEAQAREAEASAEKAGRLAEAKAAEAATAQARAAEAQASAARARDLREARFAELEAERLRHIHCPVCQGHPPGDHR